MEQENSKGTGLEISTLRRSLDLSVCIRSDDMIVLQQCRYGIPDQNILIEPDQVELLIKWLSEAYEKATEDVKF